LPDNYSKRGGESVATKDAAELAAFTLTPDEYKEMLSAICESQQLFIEEPGRPAFDKLLDLALHLTGSEYGFIGEILYDTDGIPYLKERAVYSSAWDSEHRDFLEKHYQRGFEMRNFNNLIGAVVTTGQPVIANHAQNDPRSGTIPPGHPPMKTFLGLPLYQWDEVIGVFGIANSSSGYHEAMCRELEPVSLSCASLILASKNYTTRQQVENALFASEKKHRLLFENSRDALMTLAPPSWQFTSANHATLQLFGAVNREQFTQVGFMDVSPRRQPNGRPSAEMAQEMFDKAMSEGSNSFEWEHVRLDGRQFFAHVLLTRVDVGGTPSLQATVRDITAQHQAKIALEYESQKNEMLLRTASDGIHILDKSGRLMLMSDSFCRMLGYTRNEMMGMHVSQWDAQWQDGQMRERIDQLLESGTTFETQHRMKNGDLIDVEVNARRILMDGDTMLYCSSRDITERKNTEKSILRHANYDSLTKLPNRSLFRDRLEQEVKKSHRSGWPMALMLIDLDRFKEVNDTLGHDKGDMLLVEAGRRISECVRETDTVARLGGDEFTVILSELDDTKDVDHIVRKILRRLASPFLLGEDQVFVSASVGITLYPHDSTDIDALLKNADQAMYQAKNQGRNRFSFFTAALQEAAQKRMRLINDLRNALDGNQFRVFYQPIVELASGSIHKAEALIRWEHPVHGMVNPSEFIPLAEETGMIVEIGDWIFRQAMLQCKAWRASHHPGFQISVNRSPAQFHHDLSHSKEWIRYLKSIDLPGHGLVIEITEGLLLNVEGSIQEKLLAFRDAGVQVAIDDFGTGYSSLSYLNKLDIDYLKIDQSFVRNLGNSPSDMALCEAIIIMAHKLGLKTIAEGVSAESQRDILATAECDYIQGFFYSRPVPAEEFEKLLSASSAQGTVAQHLMTSPSR
jgi:diguanylate cyclase (GGDEF)-like protein/PAS domain S-box-containing protein